MSGGGSSPSTITQKNEPPAYAQPYHMALMDQSGQAASQPYQPYPGPQVAGFVPEQQMGLNALAVRGMQGSPVDAAAQQDAVKTLSGGYLDPSTNTALSGLMDYNQGQVMKNYGSQLGRNFGNSGVNQEIGDAMAKASFLPYEAERGRMMQMAALSPTLSGTDYRDIQGVLGAGDARQAQLQQQFGLPAQAWQTAQQYPGYQQGLLSNAISATGGYGSQTQPNPYQTNPMASAIGLGTLGYMGGAAAGTAAGTEAGAMYGPYGALIGAGLGYMMGR
jgi:hypothetical protein